MSAAASPIGLTSLETRKIKRTGYLPAFLAGGLLAALVPVVNTAVRPEMFTALTDSPFHILADANWQIMAQLNILLTVCGACILYHTEYDGNAFQKAETLPVKSFGLFFGKLTLLSLSCLLPICVETLGLLFCRMHWFPERTGDCALLLKGMAFEAALLLPTAAAMLLISSLCRNMWTCLGAGVILVFLISVLPQDSAVTAVLPFATPYRMLHRMSGAQALKLLAICACEIILLCAAEQIYLKVRRCFS